MRPGDELMVRVGKKALRVRCWMGVSGGRCLLEADLVDVRVWAEELFAARGWDAGVRRVREAGEVCG